MRGTTPRRRGLISLATGLLLLGVGLFFTLGSNEYVWIDRFDDPLIYAGVLPIFFALAFLCLLRATKLLALLVALSAGSAAVALLGGLYDLTTSFDNGDTVTRKAPGHDYSAVAEPGHDMTEDLWQIRIEQDRGLTSRQWQVICVVGFTSMTWDGPGTLTVRASTDQVFTVDTSSGRPDGATAPEYWC